MSRNGSIEVSPKYGLNPTIPVCFWCGKEKNEIALMGRVRKKESKNTAYGTRNTQVVDNDVEMPMRMVLNYEPCDCCKEQFEQGVHLVEVTAYMDDERPAFTKDGDRLMYPTGRSVVIKSEAAKRMFNIDPSALEDGKKLCLPVEVFNQLFANQENI